MSARFKVHHNGVTIGSAASAWDGRELAVAFMRANRVSPVQVTDTESKEGEPFATGQIHIEAYEKEQKPWSGSIA